jgi:hypothetical protein
MFDATNPSIVPPSTVSMAMPEIGARNAPGFLNITQLLIAMFLKSPVLSVPNLKQFDVLVITQLVIVMFSAVPTGAPGRFGVLITIASSPPSM